MKQTGRFGLVWTKPSEEQLRWAAPRVFMFMLIAPILLWTLSRLIDSLSQR
jgi:hypothetical protein